MCFLILPVVLVAPLLRSDTSGTFNDSSGKARYSRHSCTAPTYCFSVLSQSDRTPPISSLLTPFHVALFAVTFYTSECPSPLLPKPLSLRSSYSRHPKVPATLSASLRFLPTSSLRQHRPHPFPLHISNTNRRFFYLPFQLLPTHAPITSPSQIKTPPTPNNVPSFAQKTPSTSRTAPELFHPSHHTFL